MGAHVSTDDLGPVLPLGPLEERRVASAIAAAQRLREVQAWAGAFAAMLEGGVCTAEDIVNADIGMWSATKRAGEALHVLGASLSCEGVA